jgi:UPF0716 protein FxsA
VSPPTAVSQKNAVATLPHVPFLILLFILVPIAEIFVIIQVGQAIGALPTVALLIVDSILGAWLLRSQGRRAWASFTEALAAGRIPHMEILNGALVILGGAFLLTPGFISDAVGLLFLIPPTRAAIARGITRMLKRRGPLRWTGVVVQGGRRPPPPRPYAEPVDPERPPELEPPRA